MRERAVSNSKSFSRLSRENFIEWRNFNGLQDCRERRLSKLLKESESHTVENSENAKSIPEFWTRAHSDGTIKKLLGITCDETYIFGICYGNLSENAKTFDYSIAAKCDKAAAVPEGFRKNIVPARTWAVFECKGKMPEAIQTMWHKIVSEFFPRVRLSADLRNGYRSLHKRKYGKLRLPQRNLGTRK